MSNQTSLYKILEPYKTVIENNLLSQVQKMGPKTPLRDACEYALLNGGKRFRPALVLMIAKALDRHVDVSLAAMGIEFFHTASLIADDLPCMDNDDLRRDKPTLHKVYGESVALLASYALIARGYECLVENGKLLKQSPYPFSSKSDEISLLAIENASYNTGVFGATGGQFLDLAPPNLTLETLKEVVHKKTGTLFEISFVIGWLFGGGEIVKLPLVKKCSHHFGMAFQIADDMGDSEQDIKNGRAINFANVLGKANAIKLFQVEVKAFKDCLKELGLQSSELVVLIEWLDHQI